MADPWVFSDISEQADFIIYILPRSPHTELIYSPIQCHTLINTSTTSVTIQPPQSIWWVKFWPLCPTYPPDWGRINGSLPPVLSPKALPQVWYTDAPTATACTQERLSKNAAIPCLMRGISSKEWPTHTWLHRANSRWNQLQPVCHTLRACNPRERNRWSNNLTPSPSSFMRTVLMILMRDMLRISSVD